MTAVTAEEVKGWSRERGREALKPITLPMASAADIPTIPAELFTKFQTSFYDEPVDAVVKALGVE